MRLGAAVVTRLRAFGFLCIAVVVAVLMILIVGTVVGLGVWPVIRRVDSRATQFASFAVLSANLAAPVLVFALFQWARARNLGGWARLFELAGLVTIISAIELVFEFLRSEGRWLILGRLTDTAMISPDSIRFALVSRVVVPSVCLAVLAGAALLMRRVHAA